MTADVKSTRKAARDVASADSETCVCRLAPLRSPFPSQNDSEASYGLAVAIGVSVAGSVVSGMTARAASSSIASTMNAA